MRIGVPKESWPGELRAALVPANVKKLKTLGFDVSVESGAGAGARYSDAEYREAGADVVADRASVLAADVVVRVRKPSAEEAPAVRSGAIHVSVLDPFLSQGFSWV